MSKRHYLVLWIGLVSFSLGALYFVIHSLLSERGTTDTHSHTYRVSISGPHPGEEFPIFKTTQGDTVTLLVSSDRRGEAHVHGYERRIRLEPGAEVALTFTAHDAGLYPLHLHEPPKVGAPDGPVLHRHLALFEVQPR